MDWLFPARRRRRLRIRGRRALGLVRKLAGLDSAALADLVRAQGALLAAQLLVWTRPVGSLVTNGGAAGGVVDRAGEVEPEAIRAALAINRAAAYGVFRPLCLVRSVALTRMLEAGGMHGSRICVGVRRVRGRFAAHAWVEYRGQVLGDREQHVSTFFPLDDLQLLRKA